MANDKKIRELMIPISEYPVVYDTDSLKDAIKILKKYLADNKEHRSILVLSKVKKKGVGEPLVGILTVRDILCTVKKNTMNYSDDEIFTMSWARFYHKAPLSKSVATCVRDVTRPLVNAFVQSEQDVTAAIQLMMSKNVNILPVFEGEKAVGIIRALDILDYIGELV